MRKILFIGMLIILTTNGTAFEVSITTQDGTSPELVFDREEDVSDYYSSFPESFSTPGNVGSYSYSDDSLRNPDILLNISGENSTLHDQHVQLFYSSNSGNLTIPLLNRASRVGDLEDGYTLLDVEISSYSALYPGKIYAGLVNRTEDSYEPENLTQIRDTLMRGNFGIDTSILRLEDQTELTFRSAKTSQDKDLHPDREVSRDVLVTVKNGGEITEESKKEIGDNLTLDFAFDGDEEIFVNSILALETEAVEPCEKVQGDRKYFILNSSRFNVNPDLPSGGESSCITILNSENSTVDFANNTIDAFLNHSAADREDDCGLTVNNSVDIQVVDSRVTQFNRGVCVLNSSGTSVSGTHTTENHVGVYLSNSSGEIQDIRMRNNISEIKSFESSKVEFTSVNLETAELTGSGSDLNIDDVQNPPPAPEGTEAISEWAEITGTENKSEINRTGFRYSPDSGSDLESVQMYKIDQEGGGYSYTNISDLSIDDQEDLIYSDRVFSSFSVFGLFREREEETDPGEGGGGGGGGSGGSGGGGGAGGLPALPGDEKAAVNLTLVNDTINLQQGETGDLKFLVENSGDAPAENLYVSGEVRTGWKIGRKDYSSIGVGENLSGSLLIEIFQGEIPGEYEVPVQAVNENGTVLDRESVTISVSPRDKMRDLNIIQAPTFMRLETGEKRSIAFLIKNTGDFDLENISAKTRNLECVESVEGKYELEDGEEEKLIFDLEGRKSEEKICKGLIVFESDGEELAIQPVRVELEKPDIVERASRNILPIIFLIWTVLTVYWTWRLRHRE